MEKYIHSGARLVPDTLTELSNHKPKSQHFLTTYWSLVYRLEVVATVEKPNRDRFPEDDWYRAPDFMIAARFKDGILDWMTGHKFRR